MKPSKPTPLRKWEHVRILSAVKEFSFFQTSSAFGCVGINVEDFHTNL